MKKTDFNKLVKKYQPVAKKTGDQLAKAFKVAEKDISKMYKVAQTHVELQMKHLQKEKLYHEIGKYVAGEIIKERIDAPGLEKYKKRLIKIESEDKKIQQTLARISKFRKKKTSSKKK